MQFGPAASAGHQVAMSDIAQNSPRFTALETKLILSLQHVLDADEGMYGDVNIANIN